MFLGFSFNNKLMYSAMSMSEKFVTIGSMIVLGIVMGGVLLGFVGCEQAPPPPSPTKVEKTEPPTEEEAAKEEGQPQETPTPEYEYNAQDRRPPFKSLVASDIPELPDVLATPNPEVLKSPLQKFDINTLKLTGIILGSLGDYARVVAPDGKSYTINVGTLVGMHEGEVITIDDNSVIVKEIMRYESGKVEEVETPLYLNPIEEGEEKS